MEKNSKLMRTPPESLDHLSASIVLLEDLQGDLANTEAKIPPLHEQFVILEKYEVEISERVSTIQLYIYFLSQIFFDIVNSIVLSQSDFVLFIINKYAFIETFIASDRRIFILFRLRCENVSLESDFYGGMQSSQQFYKVQSVIKLDSLLGRMVKGLKASTYFALFAGVC